MRCRGAATKALHSSCHALAPRNVPPLPAWHARAAANACVACLPSPLQLKGQLPGPSAAAIFPKLKTLDLSCEPMPACLQDFAACMASRLHSMWLLALWHVQPRCGWEPCHWLSHA